jgi:hypothetical protein
MDQRRGNPGSNPPGSCDMCVEFTFALIAIKLITQLGGLFD